MPLKDRGRFRSKYLRVEPDSKMPTHGTQLDLLFRIVILVTIQLEPASEDY